MFHICIEYIFFKSGIFVSTLLDIIFWEYLLCVEHKSNGVWNNDDKYKIYNEYLIINHLTDENFVRRYRNRGKKSFKEIDTFSIWLEMIFVSKMYCMLFPIKLQYCLYMANGKKIVARERRYRFCVQLRKTRLIL